LEICTANIIGKVIQMNYEELVKQVYPDAFCLSSNKGHQIRSAKYNYGHSLSYVWTSSVIAWKDAWEEMQYDILWELRA
jgi:hypothetical protein